MGCRVPECSNATERDICKPHWRIVPGDIKRRIMEAQELGRTSAVEEHTAAAVAFLANKRLHGRRCR